ncbi:hypothetical protein WL30_08425 [Burkholderia ubonensis]|uniref:HEPN AbiU2-like domain-containing protein n=1 Tax=Burkholderia ubonensis TaxID=101571 RepID=A0ABD4DZ05_9BURK|nr:hypothetical protein [Burkholderia ubonensis]KVN80025.1 hypothetical protein WJ68_00570 [Burkholderia ubonensis]KVO03600.1 hypothetical protein WJ69_26280 [Burkholderia ubonensis]KVZ66486.1 hypothetical protein WL19_23185 [Burkholderia ubonensis]KVZ82209.1 hypothetical protein WL24_16090 [Burkholderia ubonensis]KWA75286.1 hypothetical protein WL30_08425 [Burkholderia ubonensis]
MSDDPRLLMELDRTTETEVANRAKRRMRCAPPPDVDDVSKSIHFLRGVGSRASFVLTSFYFLLATEIDGKRPCTVPGYPGKVLQSYLQFGSLNNLALACRKVFDHGAKGLTGAQFGKQRDETLKGHAEYWAKSSQRPIEDAYSALHFLRTFFAKCSKTDTALFREGTTLGRRIGFIKQYADHSAAHLSLGDYEFNHLDLAHVVAALVLVGEIIRSFDAPYQSTDYYDQIDQASFDASVALFPDTHRIRLFQNMKVESQARMCWQVGEAPGIQMLTEQLPYATGWF